jgi:hypothetical protein
MSDDTFAPQIETILSVFGFSLCEGKNETQWYFISLVCRFFARRGEKTTYEE